MSAEYLDDMETSVDEAHVIFLAADFRARLEASVWEDLAESVEEGWRSQQEAEDLFMDWRSTHRSN